MNTEDDADADTLPMAIRRRTGFRGLRWRRQPEYDTPQKADSYELSMTITHQQSIAVR